MIRSPVGEVRVWIDVEGQPRTSIHSDHGLDDAAAQAVRDLTLLLDRAHTAVKGLVAALGPQARSVGFTAWLRTHCDLGNPHARTPSADLYRSYSQWAQAEGCPPLSLRAFGDSLAAHGLPSAGKNANGQKYRGGVTLRAEPLRTEPPRPAPVSGEPVYDPRPPVSDADRPETEPPSPAGGT